MIGRVIRWGGLDWVGFREVDRGAFFLSVAALFPAPFDAGRGVGFFGSSLFRQLHEDFLPGLKKRAASEDGSGFRVREFLMTDGAGVRAEATVGLMSWEGVRRRSDFIPAVDCWWWTRSVSDGARGTGIRAAASDGKTFGYFDSSEEAAVWVRPMICLVEKVLK